ncbi:FMRF-Like Peptide [Caenorhabditis elegans]|uniref:FMRF-Like Peptide n=1 Tax=Caenorhabditis elegans TaxID=6239 RepID=Q86G91_CAEEL|nr:FMRF-Like Peptide [Caenorhabditis elegans]CAD82918.1 FMRF-Like Peptide [Caenorhabditis elegans]|eukprot:NP_871818.1 FMRF-Like Peptide [Caenorhabditis elegans]
MRFLILIVAIVLLSAVHGFSVEPRLAAFADGGAAELAQEARQARNAELEFIKRFLPAKERRAPLEGFEDMSGFLRTIDGIQKPRFG